MGGDLEARSLASPSRPLDPWAWFHKGHPQPETPTPNWPGFQKKAQGTGNAIYTLGTSQDVTRGCLATTGRSEEVASLGIRGGTIQNSNMN